MGNEPSITSGSNDPPRSPVSHSQAVSSWMGGMRHSAGKLFKNAGETFGEYRGVLDLRAQLHKRTFFPLAEKSLADMIVQRGWEADYPTPADWRAGICGYLGAVDLVGTIVTQDGRKLDTFWVPAAESFTRRREMTCILCHANAMLGLDMFDHASWYANQGFDVLVLTMGGYGASEGVAGELSSYRDILAAVDYCTQVRKLQPRQLVLHGLSLGGALAATGALIAPGAHVVLDQNVSLAIIRGQAGWVPEWAQEQATAALFEKGLPLGVNNIVTDGYNTAAKLSLVQGEVFVLSASEDDMMPPHFASELVAARYPSANNALVMKSRHTLLNGGHAVFFGREQPGTAVLIEFLQAISAPVAATRTESLSNLPTPNTSVVVQATPAEASGFEDQISLGQAIPFDDDDIAESPPTDQFQGNAQSPEVVVAQFQEPPAEALQLPTFLQPAATESSERLNSQPTPNATSGGTTADGKWLI